MLIDSGFIVPIQGRPRKPLFPKWYDINIGCDYHSGVPGHSTKNYSALKRKVESLIKDGKPKFDESNEPVGLEDLSRAKANM